MEDQQVQPAEAGEYHTDTLPLVAQFRAETSSRAYVINPDGSIGFSLEPWDGR
jgi:hypothetical protein